MKELRMRVRRIVYALGAMIIALILLRFGLNLLAASPNNPIINLIYQITYIFVSPFVGIAQDIQNGSVSIEISSIIALILWLAFTLIFAELLTTFMYDNAREVILNLVNVMFKFVEFFLLARILMRGFGVPTGVNGFVDAIYYMAGIVYVPFEGIAPGLEVPTGIIEFSTLLALIIVIVIDIVTEGFLKSLLPEPELKPTAEVIVTQPPLVQPMQPQHVNIYIPPAQMPQQAPVVVNNNLPNPNDPNRRFIEGSTNG